MRMLVGASAARPSHHLWFDGHPRVRGEIGGFQAEFALVRPRWTHEIVAFLFRKALISSFRAIQRAAEWLSGQDNGLRGPHALQD